MSYKRINASEIINIADQEFSMKQIVVMTNEEKPREVTLRIQPKLNETKILELVADLVSRSEYCAKNNIEFKDIYIVNMLLIKYFTDIKFNTYKSLEKTFKHELDLIEALINLGLFDKIVNYFDAETMDKINYALKEQSKAMQIITNNKLKEMIENELDSEVEIRNEEEF